MKKILNCIIVIAVLFFFFASSYAEGKTNEVMYQFSGTVVSLGNTRITVSSKLSRDTRRTVTFLITKTTIIRGKLTRGSIAHVTYTLDRTGKRSPARTALVIRVIETEQKNIQGEF